MAIATPLPRLRPASGELLHLDLMRFVASIGIVFHHSHEFFTPLAERASLIDRTAGLALFVDLFFVISGYVIAHVYHDRINSPRGYATFLQRRVGRLVPLHWLTLIVAIAIWSLFALFQLSGHHTPSFRPACIIETALLTHSFIPCGNGVTFNGVTWSISAEMVMYVAFPLFAFIGGRSAKFLLWIGLATLAALMAIVLARQGWNWHGRDWTEVSPVSRALPSFVFGSALFYNRKILAKLAAPDLILATATIVLIAAMMNGVPELLDLLLVYLVAVAAVAADLRGVVSALVRRLAPLGQLTYSIYMWHTLFILILMNAIGDKLLHGRAYSTFILAIICYFCMFTMSYFSFFFIETPARRWVDKLDLSKLADFFRPPSFVPVTRNMPEPTEPRNNS